MSKARDLADASPVAHGQCRFVYVSPTECRLVPYNGNGLICGRKQGTIPSAGVMLSNSGLGNSTTYYVYARLVGTVLTLDARTDAHSTGADGVEIMTGDTSRSLVGMLVTSATGQFVYTVTAKQVASWFNRRLVEVHEDAVNSDTSANVYVQLTPGVNILGWAGSALALNATGVARGVNAAGLGAYLQLRVGGSEVGGGDGYSLGAQGAQSATAISAVYTPSADGLQQIRPYGYTPIAGNSVRFRQGLTAVSDI